MSTRSRIGIPRVGGEVESIYVHFDGYPEGVGQTLADHWMKFDDIIALIGLGDLSILGEEIGVKHQFHIDFGTTATEAEKRMCTAYGRDRGETGVESRFHPYEEWPDSGQEWEYLAMMDMDHKVYWQVREAAYGGSPVQEWRPLVKVLAETTA